MIYTSFKDIDFISYSSVKTFGCSFTKWRWPMWSDILNACIDIPVTNYAQAGASVRHLDISMGLAESQETDKDCLYIAVLPPVLRYSFLTGAGWDHEGQGYVTQTAENKFPFGLHQTVVEEFLALQRIVNCKQDLLLLHSTGFYWYCADIINAELKNLSYPDSYTEMLDYYRDKFDNLKQFDIQQNQLSMLEACELTGWPPLQYTDNGGNEFGDYHPFPSHMCNFLKNNGFDVDPKIELKAQTITDGFEKIQTQQEITELTIMSGVFDFKEDNIELVYPLHVR